MAKRTQQHVANIHIGIKFKAKKQKPKQRCCTFCNVKEEHGDTLRHLCTAEPKKIYNGMECKRPGLWTDIESEY